MRKKLCAFAPLRELLWITVFALLCSCRPPVASVDSQLENRIPFDPDLYSWKTASWTPFAVADTISGFAYGVVNGQDRYVAVAQTESTGTGAIGWSDDGDIWHKAQKAPDDPAAPAPNPFAEKFNAAAFGGGVFVVVADDGKTAWSHDGINWNAGEIAFFGTEPIMGIAYGNGIFAAVGGNANIALSSDGVTWNSYHEGAFGTSMLCDIAFGGNNFYVVGEHGKRGCSVDAASGSWTFYELPYASTPPFGKNTIRKVAVGQYNGSAIIGVVFDEWGDKRTAITSNDDFSNLDAGAHNDMFFNNNINGIAWGGGNFVAAGTGAFIGWLPAARQSQNYWRALSFTQFRWWEITALSAMKDRFFVGNIGGKIGYSK